jgi:hypothetical protein
MFGNTSLLSPALQQAVLAFYLVLFASITISILLYSRTKLSAMVPSLAPPACSRAEKHLN